MASGTCLVGTATDVIDLGTIAAGLDGSVWVFLPDGFFRLGDRRTHLWFGARSGSDDPVSALDDIEVGPEGTIWVNRWETEDRPARRDALWSFDGERWTVRRRTPADAVLLGVEVLADGTVLAGWNRGQERADRTPAAGRVDRLTAGEWERLPGSAVGGHALSRWVIRADWHMQVTFGVADDGTVWLGNPGGGPRGSLHRFEDGTWTQVQDFGLSRLDDHAYVQADVGPDGTVWVHLRAGHALYQEGHGGDILARFDGTEWSHFRTSDGLPIVSEGKILQKAAFDVAPDGSLWFTPIALPGDPEAIRGIDHRSQLRCQGIGRLDGATLRRYLPGRCIYALDIGPDGAVWLQAGEVTTWLEDDRVPVTPYTVDTYVIIPEVGST